MPLEREYIKPTTKMAGNDNVISIVISGLVYAESK